MDPYCGRVRDGRGLWWSHFVFVLSDLASTKEMREHHPRGKLHQENPASEMKKPEIRRVNGERKEIKKRAKIDKKMK